MKLFQPKWDKLKNEFPLMRVEVGTQMEGKVDVTFGIEFGKVGELEHTEPLSMLSGMLQGTTGLVSEVEAEIDRLFP